MNQLKEFKRTPIKCLSRLMLIKFLARTGISDENLRVL